MSTLPIVKAPTKASARDLPDLIARGALDVEVEGESSAEEVNAMLRAFAERARWYEEMLDSIPFPISVTDENMAWTFVNRAAEEVSGKKRHEVLGMQCHNWGADICQTERCGIAMLRKGEPRSFFKQPGIERDFQVDVAYLSKGHIEVVQDVTEVEELRAKAEAEAEARRQEAAQLQTNMEGILSVLEDLSSGDLRLTRQLSEQGTAGQISRAVTDLVRKLQSDVHDLSVASRELKELAENGESQSELALSAADHASQELSNAVHQMKEATTSVARVSSSVDELNRSIESVAEGAKRGSVVAHEAVQNAQSADQLVARLGESSSQIGEVVKVINAIARQTNLLSLNATIEAARAGEVGKGFAVVAHEVKELAKDTSKATDEIASQVRAIREDSSESASAISEIGAVISRINDLQAEISTAVVTQADNTSTIASTFDALVRSTADAGASIDKVVDASSQVRTVADNTRQNAVQLAQTAERLSKLVQRFTLPPSAGRPEARFEPQI